MAITSFLTEVPDKAYALLAFGLTLGVAAWMKDPQMLNLAYLLAGIFGTLVTQKLVALSTGGTTIQTGGTLASSLNTRTAEASALSVTQLK